MKGEPNMKGIKTALVGAALAVAGAVNAMAEPLLDFTGVATSITQEISPAITAALPIAGTVLGVYLGYKVFRRFVK